MYKALISSFLVVSVATRYVCRRNFLSSIDELSSDERVRTVSPFLCFILCTRIIFCLRPPARRWIVVVSDA